MDKGGRDQLRQEYRTLQKDAKSACWVCIHFLYDSDSPVKIPVDKPMKLDTCSINVPSIFSVLEKPREQKQDAELFSQLTHIGCQGIRRLATTQPGRSSTDFIVALKGQYARGLEPQTAAKDNPEAFDWAAMAANAVKFMRQAPGMNCMLGPMSVQAKVRKMPTQRVKKQVGVLVRPDVVERIDQGDKQETDQNMEEMWNILNKVSSCPVPELVCNPLSFSQTIENLFTLSFLVRDQRVKLTHDAEAGLLAVRVDKPSSAPKAAGEEQAQFVLDLTIKDWEMMCTIVKQQDCHMKHREHQEAQEKELTIRKRKASMSGFLQWNGAMH
ncbi:hypothetical protein QJQ45_021133 [Haematococcus lacustris]|nr:hypothetical protein QJQ45_021133 [Haematococcus lacustris]